MVEAMTEAMLAYSDEELTLSLDFIKRSAAVMEQEAAKLRGGAAVG